MSKRILSVSYDASLLATRQMLLETQGYAVTSALGYTDAISFCNDPAFDLFVLGHSIPLKDKQELVRTFKSNCKAPVLSLERWGEPRAVADFHAQPDNPAEFLNTVRRILVDSGEPSLVEDASTRDKP